MREEGYNEIEPDKSNTMRVDSLLCIYRGYNCGAANPNPRKKEIVIKIIFEDIFLILK